jgi:site-specific DNA recombinase
VKKPHTSLQAIGYARVSTEEQARHGISLDAQVERIKAYCVAAGLQLAGIISEEGVSGSKPLSIRPGGQQLVGSIPPRGHIVALKLDRLFRDAADALT